MTIRLERLTPEPHSGFQKRREVGQEFRVMREMNPELHLPINTHTIEGSIETTLPIIRHARLYNLTTMFTFPPEATLYSEETVRLRKTEEYCCILP